MNIEEEHVAHEIIEPKFKVGDRVLDLIHGWGIIDLIREYGLALPIHVDFGDDENNYCLNGKYAHTAFASSLLTESEAALLGHYPPKKKVKMWVNIHPNGHCTGLSYRAGSLCNTKEQAINSIFGGFIDTVPVEFEIEE